MTDALESTVTSRILAIATNREIDDETRWLRIAHLAMAQVEPHVYVDHDPETGEQLAFGIFGSAVEAEGFAVAEDQNNERPPAPIALRRILRVALVLQ